MLHPTDLERRILLAALEMFRATEAYKLEENTGSLDVFFEAARPGLDDVETLIARVEFLNTTDENLEHVVRHPKDARILAAARDELRRRSRIEVEIDPAASIHAVAAGAADVLVQLNGYRETCGHACLRPTRLTLDVELAEVSEEQDRLLEIAEELGYRDRQPFQSPEAVRAYFTGVQSRHRPGAPVFALEVLASVADAVIATRTHCEF